ncbi:GntP family permease [Aestuariirhabdus litorea]|uniref:GntP family permease n=1 Tax=Aestuariirhabdus litorea TaxID=2528527 RepID=A0A3P3VJ80_9GAMM|nr:GntP family permease [Aestuariirhabdus litorea]RRJ82414.1 GntP family permease [Aestuariirhabdus litorea]RWW92577.1 GntP family permease [Endozoicomonadaceae bacterium GTF-13]
MESIGLLGSVVLLIWLALRGVNIILASLLCSLLVILTSGLSLADSLNEYYAFGPLGAFTFAGKFFLLFAAGAVFGRVMGESHAASSIALSLIRVMGAHRALVITTLACAALTYGGVVTFVVIFAMYPLGLKLLQEADIPKRLFCAALALGAGTFTMTALPGTPSIHNVISASSLGTDLFAGFWIGLVSGLLMLLIGLWYLERQRLAAARNGERFVPAATDQISTVDASDYPSWKLACLPLIFVMLVIILPRLISLSMDIETLAHDSLLYGVLKFALSQPILWPSIALTVGTLLAVALFEHIRGKAMKVLGDGTQDSIMPLINTAAVVGFGGIVVHTSGFAQFSSMMLESGLPPLISAFTSISLVSAITGSATGGLQIFMQTMAPAYLEMGVEPQTLHRIATMASGGFDSLPHCGAIIAMLSVTGLNHKEAYRDVGVITVVIPVAVTLAMIGVIGVIG